MSLTVDDLPKRPSWLLRLSAVATVLVLIVAGTLMWSDRFRCECETEEVVFSVLGIEQDGAVLESFAGANFLKTLQKMGLGFKSGSLEARERFADYYFGDIARANESRNVPFVWIYARGRTDAAKDAGYYSGGKFFFEGEKFVFSVVDPRTRFAVQLDPDSFTVFHAKTGDAIAAIPLPVRPVWNDGFNEDFFENWLLRIESKKDTDWERLGEFECRFISQSFDIPAESYGNKRLTDEEREQIEALPVPALTATVTALSFPHDLRTFSTLREESEKFGTMKIALAGTENFYHWQLENFALGSKKTLEAALWSDAVPADVRLFAPTDPQQVCLTAPDRFHSNVRFLENESFGSLDGNELTVPIAKTIFPREDDMWAVYARLVKVRGFGQKEILAEQKIKLGKGSNQRISYAGRTCRVRAFFDENYFRILKGAPPALVLEVADLPSLSKEDAPELFFVPANVRSDGNEILVPESVVIVRPGVYQYWFLPSVPVKELFVMLGVSRVVTAEGFAFPPSWQE
ncbi:MAG: hypothetical protein K6B46_06070 [Opitutales bacterium]|nr:hypothetical protein [Opitutales bacterium]